MIIQEFAIPFDKDELVRTHFDDYGRRTIVSLQMMSSKINAISQQQLTDTGPVQIMQQKQDVFLSIIVHGNKIELSVLLRAFAKILKIVQNLISLMEKRVEQTKNLVYDQNERIGILSTNKLLAYLMSSILPVIEEKIADANSNNNMEKIGRRKKDQPKSTSEEEWEALREKSLETVYRWLQLPLKSLWSPPIVEDTFVGVLSQICYKILEKTKDIRSKSIQNIIFQILGTLVKSYNHGIACVVQIIQLAKFYEALAAPIGTGVVLMVTESGCTKLIKEIAKEIEESEPGETDARNFGNFFEAIANTKAEILLPVLDNIMDYLANDCYVMRNCAIGVMGCLVANVLTGEDLPPEKRAARDECLDNLEEHILDCNAYTRSKVLQTWQKLCCEGAIPLSRQNRLLKAAVLRLEDKSANVRKQALQLLRAILQSNPFASKMNQEKFSQNLNQAKAELKQLQTQIYHFVGAEEEKEELWKTQLPLIEEAINMLTEEEKNDNEENEENKDREEIDIKETFDKIQHYILKDKCLKAVKYLKKLFLQSGFAKEMKNVSEETKKEALLLFMYKIFMNSSAKKDNDKNKDKKRQSLTTDQEEIKVLDQIKVKKKLVDYLQNCLTFSLELEKTIPIVEKLLYSQNPGDAIEACSFMGAAYQFQIAGALHGVRQALFQMFCPDQSVRENVVNVYKEIYLDLSGNQMTSRQKALLSVKALIQLLDGMQPGQSTALAKLVVSWRTNNELDAEALKVMWEMFSLKLANTTPEESRAALMLLTMAAEVESNIITDNLDVLIKVGLGPRAQTDLLLARDTCRAFLTIKQDVKDIFKNPIKYPNDHEMFTSIGNLMKESFFEEKENGYISFATDAINAIYHLADEPNDVLDEIIGHVCRTGKFIRAPGDANVEIPSPLISRLLFLIGHTGIRLMVFLDKSVYNELKRRNAIKEKKKEMNARRSRLHNRKSMNASTISTISAVSSASIMGSAQRSIRGKQNDDDQEDAMEGATADDTDAEHIKMVLEQEVLGDTSYFSNFLPLILDVCQHPEKYPDETVQAHGVLALSKLMTINSNFCENNLQLLVTLLERSSHPQIKANILIALADLMTQFPNQIEPWTAHIYGRLKDPSLIVRNTCVKMLSNLILGEMIRVKGQVAQLALCIIDENETIRSDTRQLFKDLSQKGNALYNVMPDILSCLSDSELNLAEKDFQEIIKYILGLLQKDRQVDSIIEKLCSRFKLATTERQWRDLSYSLSLLKFGVKGIRILINNLPLLKEKIHNDDVLKSLNCIIETAKRRPDAKTACLELEEKIKELLESTENNEEAEAGPRSDSEVMPPPPVPKSTKKKGRRVRRNEDEDEDVEDEEESDENNENRSMSRNNSMTRRQRRENTNSKNDSGTNSESEEEEATNKTPSRPTRRNLRTPKQEKEMSGPSRTPRRRRNVVESPSPSGKRTRSTRSSQ